MVRRLRFRSILLPNLTPAIIAGCALAFARAIGEFGSLVLLTGNVPFKTQAASVYIYGRVQTSDYSGAAAVSVLLLTIAVGVLFAINRRTSSTGLVVPASSGTPARGYDGAVGDIATMQDAVACLGAALRPHFKTHRTLHVARGSRLGRRRSGCLPQPARSFWHTGSTPHSTLH
jgi:hypothetical protein